MAKYVGKDAKVTIGANTIVAMGNWTVNGISTAELDASSFGDQWMTYLYGMKDGGTVTFSGHADLTDTTGQQICLAANVKNSALPDLRFYLNNTSYFVPNQTTDYFAPAALSTGMGTPGLCSVNITQWNINADKGGIVPISFTARVNGCMAVV